MKLNKKHKKAWRFELRDEIKFLLKKGFNESWHNKRLWKVYNVLIREEQIIRVPINESKKYQEQGFMLIGLETVNGKKIHELVNKKYFLNNL